jgi:hypothetical protein
MHAIGRDAAVIVTILKPFPLILIRKHRLGANLPVSFNPLNCRLNQLIKNLQPKVKLN